MFIPSPTEFNTFHSMQRIWHWVLHGMPGMERLEVQISADSLCVKGIGLLCGIARYCMCGMIQSWFCHLTDQEEVERATERRSPSSSYTLLAVLPSHLISASHCLYHPMGLGQMGV